MEALDVVVRKLEVHRSHLFNCDLRTAKGGLLDDAERSLADLRLDLYLVVFHEYVLRHQRQAAAWPGCTPGPVDELSLKCRPCLSSSSTTEFCPALTIISIIDSSDSAAQSPLS